MSTEITEKRLTEQKFKTNEKTNEFIRVLKEITKNRLAFIGLLIIALQIFLAIFAPLITHHDPVKQNLSATHLPLGSEEHWLGTDQYGRDMWSRIVYGARVSLLAGIAATGLGLLGGVILGLLAGYYNKLDGLIMRFNDLLFAFPSILLALLIIAILGTSLVNVVIAISIWSIPSTARIIRGSVLSIKKQEYIQAMKSLGASDTRIILKHVLPNCVAPIIVIGTMKLATVLLSTASLSYLGLGAQPPTPEWGAMISDGQDYMWDSPHLVIIPGVAIMLIVFAFNVVGDALRDALDPQMDQYY